MRFVSAIILLAASLGFQNPPTPIVPVPEPDVPAVIFPSFRPTPPVPAGEAERLEFGQVYVIQFNVPFKLIDEPEGVVDIRPRERPDNVVEGTWGDTFAVFSDGAGKPEWRSFTAKHLVFVTLKEDAKGKVALMALVGETTANATVTRRLIDSGRGPQPPPVPPKPKPDDPDPPPIPPTSDFTKAVSDAFGPSGKADAKKWAKLYGVLAEAVVNNGELKTTNNLYTFTVGEERKAVLSLDKYPTFAAIISAELAAYGTPQPLTDALRTRIATSFKKIGDACTAAAGAAGGAK